MTQTHSPAPVAAPRDAWYVYILRCADGTLYTGIARNVQRRLRQHNGELGGGPRYTRGRRPVALLWREAAADRAAAQRLEALIKGLRRAEKLVLVRGPGAGGGHPGESGPLGGG